MSVQTEVSALVVAAMKAHDAARLSALRMLKAALMNKEVEKGRALEDAESLQVVTSLIKQRRESIDQFTKGGRLELAEKEAAEIRVLEGFLPPPVDTGDLTAIVARAVGEVGATSPKDLGRVMKALMPKLAGMTVDGKVVRDLVQKQLEGLR